jgi:uncharacterized protein
MFWLIAAATLCWQLSLPAYAQNVSTSIFDLARAGDLAGVQQLVASGVDVNARDETGETPLITTALAGQDDVASFLANHGADLMARTNKGMTALHAAAYSGDEVIAKMLIEHGANVNDHANIARITPLHAAAEEDHLGVAEELIKSGANVHLVEVNGYTAGSRAGWRGHWDVLKVLLLAGDACQPEDVSGEPLYKICTHLIP